jgi:heptaprenyl diphosphate synthase
MKLIDIYSRKKRDMVYIEKALVDSVHTDHDQLLETSSHLIKAGGKRIRPVFVLIAAEFGTYDIQRLKNLAVPLELIHMATLVHDDVIDDADLRRGQLTVRSKWDNRIAMYTGDYIFAKALMMLTQIENIQVHQIISKAIVQMCIGEMEQIRFFFHTEQTVRDYFHRIKRKTALLIAISCQLGAIVAQAPAPIANRLYSFGYNVGMAFQIRDDILDLCGTEKEIGKPPGSDIRQGNITLPIIYALQNEHMKSAILDELQRIQALDGQTDVSKLIGLIVQSGGIEKADALAMRYMDKAIAALETLPEQQAKKDYIEIAHFLGKRSY